MYNIAPGKCTFWLANTLDPFARGFHAHISLFICTFPHLLQLLCFFVLSNLPRASITRWLHTACLPLLKLWINNWSHNNVLFLVPKVQWIKWKLLSIVKSLQLAGFGSAHHLAALPQLFFLAPWGNLQTKSEIQSPCQSHDSLATHVHSFAAKTKTTQAVLNNTCMWCCMWVMLLHAVSRG